MKNLKTRYMGIEIDNPIILGASNMATDLDMLKKAEELGAGAIVYKSLFEEQIQLERFQLDERLSEFNDLNQFTSIDFKQPQNSLIQIIINGKFIIYRF